MSVVFGVDSRVLFTAVVGLIALQRLMELRVARRNTFRLLNHGGTEVAADHYPWMVALHTAFLASSVAEVWISGRALVPWISLAAMVVLLAAQGLRLWVLQTLGDRWTTRVIVVPGEELVESGPYRWLRHPNYLAVALEIAAIPLLHSAWLTATVFSFANFLLLGVRIRTEERALATAGANPREGS